MSPPRSSRRSPAFFAVPWVTPKAGSRASGCYADGKILHLVGDFWTIVWKPIGKWWFNELSMVVFHGTFMGLTSHPVMVVEPYPSEKYEFVNWDDDIPNWMENEKMFQTTKPDPLESQWDTCAEIGLFWQPDHLPKVQDLFHPKQYVHSS